MNDYNRYKLGKWIEKSVDKFFDFVFYIPRQQYKNNEKFRKWIQKRESERSRKQNIKRIMGKVFREIVDNGGTCTICTFDSYDGNYPSDLQGLDYEVLLKSDCWIGKNNLQVEKMSFYNYIEQYHIDMLMNFNCYYDWKSRKDKTVLIVRRRK
jgi:hypothetical protein